MIYIEIQTGGIFCSDIISHTSDLASVAGNIAGAFSQVLSAAGIAVFVINFLYGRYQKIPSSALCLGAYIVDLTLILHDLFVDMLIQDPPRPVSREFVQDTLHKYKTSDSLRVHELVRDIVYGRQVLRPEEKIADLIRKELKMDPMQDLTAYGAHNEQIEVRNQRQEVRSDQISVDSMGGSNADEGEDYNSGVPQREQDSNTGDNSKVECSIPNQNTDVGGQGVKHEDPKRRRFSCCICL
ncbi:hypothetical protein VKT23_016096 [Stygiomarasmius scandens]|uniref:Uncharacterized protein n=1 Tax=Marasmiellus scandens TaxID=2682957 RepID=A0ABR1IXB6_9AGAR